MPVLNYMDFAKHNLRLSYRGSMETQTLTVDVATAELARISIFFAHMSMLQGAINFGAGGSDIFPPWQGFMGWAEATPEEERGPTYHAEVPIVGVAPVMMRVIVETLRGSGFHQPVDAMAIHGSLPLDESPLSITEVDIKRWIEDQTTYPKLWPEIPFPIREKRGNGSFHIHIRLGGPIPTEGLDHAKCFLLGWANMIDDLPLEDGSGALQLGPNGSVAPFFPRVKLGEREIWAKMQKMPFVREPSLNILKNMLCCFHHKVVGIERVEFTC